MEINNHEDKALILSLLQEIYKAANNQFFERAGFDGQYSSDSEDNLIGP